MEIPEVILNSGHVMPLIGMGTMELPLPPNEELVSIFIDAIESGYRHFDTAAAYGSELALGQAVAKALEKGLVKNRDELFITSKLWCSDTHPDLVLPALKKTLRNLGLSYLDLYLIHWPVSMKLGSDIRKFSKEDMVPFDIAGTWKAMEECSELGLAKSIGVCNFSCVKLEKLFQKATIPPAVNQVEMNAAWQQKKLLKFCQEKGVNLSAWSPLGANGAKWGSDRVVNNPILQEIADKKGKSVAQVALRWIHEQGASAIVKSFNKERMKQNLQIFDWKLSKEEVNQIEQIPQFKGYSGDMFVHENGPYKSVEELWDGEI